MNNILVKHFSKKSKAKKAAALLAAGVAGSGAIHIGKNAYKLNKALSNLSGGKENILDGIKKEPGNSARYILTGSTGNTIKDIALDIFQFSDRIHACFGFLDDVKDNLKSEYDFMRMPKKCPECGEVLSECGYKIYNRDGFHLNNHIKEGEAGHIIRCKNCAHTFTVRGPRGAGYSIVSNRRSLGPLEYKSHNVYPRSNLHIREHKPLYSSKWIRSK